LQTSFSSRLPEGRRAAVQMMLKAVWQMEMPRWVAPSPRIAGLKMKLTARKRIRPRMVPL
jgi:hypothetical protein